jgi:hypothetical protein
MEKSHFSLKRRKYTLVSEMLKKIGVAILAVFLSLTVISGPVFALVGDVNGDGIVDLKDVYIVGKAYGSYPGHPKWNPAADLNGDLKVDLKDFVIVVSNFGKTG